MHLKDKGESFVLTQHIVIGRGGRDKLDRILIAATRINRFAGFGVGVDDYHAKHPASSSALINTEP